MSSQPFRHVIQPLPSCDSALLRRALGITFVRWRMGTGSFVLSCTRGGLRRGADDAMDRSRETLGAQGSTKIAASKPARGLWSPSEPSPMSNMDRHACGLRGPAHDQLLVGTRSVGPGRTVRSSAARITWRRSSMARKRSYMHLTRYPFSAIQTPIIYRQCFHGP